MNEAAQLAYKAAEVMSERGHCKNRLSDDEGRVCFVGALNMAAGIESVYYIDSQGPWEKVWNMSLNILDERGVLFPNPVTFNNDPQTTGEDVILLLKEAGKRLEDDEVHS